MGSLHAQTNICCRTNCGASGVSRDTSYPIATQSETLPQIIVIVPPRRRARQSLSFAAWTTNASHLLRVSAIRLKKRTSMPFNRVICRKAFSTQRSFASSPRESNSACSTLPTWCPTQRSTRRNLTARNIARMRAGSRMSPWFC